MYLHDSHSCTMIERQTPMCQKDGQTTQRHRTRESTTGSDDMTRNQLIKQWIIEALITQPTPLSAKGTLEVIKMNRSKKTTSRRSPNLSPIKLATIMMRMPEIECKPGFNHSQPHVYWIKTEKRKALIA